MSRSQRSVARLAAIQALYQMEVSGVGVVDETRRHRTSYQDMEPVSQPCQALCPDGITLFGGDPGTRRARAISTHSMI